MRLRHHALTTLLLCYSNLLQACLVPETQPVSTTIAPALLSTEPREVVIYNNASLSKTGSAAEVALYHANTLILIDRLQQWPVSAGSSAAILASPALLDTNYDGLTDAIYLVDMNGLLWFVSLDGRGFGVPELVADFSVSGYQFTQPLQLVPTRSPVPSGQLLPQNILLITATDANGHSLIIAFKHHLQTRRVAQLNDLTDRSSIDADEVRYGIAESMWAEMQQSAGWYVRLARQVISQARVYAGVVYLLSAKPASVTADCQLTADADALLHSFHLHHAGLVYSNRYKAVQLQNAGELTLQQQNGSLHLFVQQEQTLQLAESNVLAISDDCADCNEPLSPAQFPQLIRLATFLAEYGAH